MGPGKVCHAGHGGNSMPSPKNAFSTVLPTYHEWIELTGGIQSRTDPLLKFIDQKVKSHELLFKRFKRRPKWGLLWERLGCEVELLWGTGMYISASKGRHQQRSGSTAGLSRDAFGAGRMRRDGQTTVNAPQRFKGGADWNRIDAIEALHSLTEEDLKGLTNARDRTSLYALIRNAKVCDIDPEKYAEDKKVIDPDRGRTAAKYLGMNELGKYRVMLDSGVLKMRVDSNSTKSPYEWVPAETNDASNPCAGDLVDALKKTGSMLGKDSKQDAFKRGEEAFVNWYRREHTGKVAASGYVLTPGQRLYMSSEHKSSSEKNRTQGFFHSAYTKGGGVTSSGSIRVERGIPTLLTNFSGHYRPEPRKLDYMLRLFAINSIPRDRLAVLVMTGDGYNVNYYFYRPGELNEFLQDLRTM